MAQAGPTNKSSYLSLSLVLSLRRSLVPHRKQKYTSEDSKQVSPFDLTPYLGFDVFQSFSRRAECGARYLCKASTWEALRNSETETETQTQEEGQREIGRRAWPLYSLLSVFSTPVCPSLPPSFYSLQRHGQSVWICVHMCFFALSDIFSDEWKWIINQSWHILSEALLLM